MFDQALIASARRLRTAIRQGRLGSFALVGALAVARWARPRSTGDIDYAIRLNEALPQDLAAHVNGTYRAGDFDDPLLGTISYSESVASDKVPIQLLIFPAAWEKVALAEVGELRISGHTIPIAGWKGLVLLKLYAGSALDLEDARAIVAQVRPSGAEMKDLNSKAACLRVSRRLQRILVIAH